MSAELTAAPRPGPTAAPSGFALSDVYYVLFRHKLKIIVCTLAGIAFGISAYYLRPPPYQSEAKLFIRYVSEAKSPVPTGAVSTAKSPDQRGETIMDSEMEIITSWDLARQVAETIGARTILGPSEPEDLNRAAGMIKGGLTVETPPRSSVIRLLFRHDNPTVVNRVLRELIDHYLRMHLEIHRAVGLVGDFLTQETDQIRSRLTQTEDELRKVRNKAGVISLDESKKLNVEQMATLRQQIFAITAELAERKALLQAKRRPADGAAAPAASPPPVEPTPPPPERLEEYHNLTARLTLLRRMEQELLTQFREENTRVQDVRSQIATAEQSRRRLEEEFPTLIRPSLPAATPNAAAPEVGSVQEDAARIAALESRLNTLNLQVAELRGEAANLDLAERAIVDLQRKRELEEANFRYYSASLEQARVDEALGSGRVSNISEIQSPSPPMRDRARAARMYALLGGSGIVLGIGWAFLIELYLDRTVKKPADVERLLGAPALLSIPHVRASFARGLATLLPLAGRKSDASAASGGQPLAPQLVPYHETLRDRLTGFFQAQANMHKPKLVAVTGIGAAAGTSTTAAGLARSLSDVGEGNVLLVDLSGGRQSAHHYVGGELRDDLEGLLDPQAADGEQKLYVVAENAGSDALARNLPRRYWKLAPRLKASAFDYIIFDLPPVSPISITPRIAGFMDMVLLVVRSEHTEQDLLRRASQMLAETSAPVGVVLNQTRAYLPARLKLDFPAGN